MDGISGEAPEPPRRAGWSTDDDVVVLYATAETVAALSGEPGYGVLAFRLRGHECDREHAPGGAGVAHGYAWLHRLLGPARGARAR